LFVSKPTNNISTLRTTQKRTTGADYPALLASLAQLSPGFKAPYLAAETSWSLVVEGAGKTLSMAEQDTARWKVVAELPFEGKIALKTPDCRYWLIEDYATPTDTAPRHLYFGRELKAAARARELVGVGDLKRRAYLGPTSLDNEVALLMASFAHITKGSFVLDPFVGTGSILIACAQFGAHLCMGTDIDIRVLRGKKGRNVNSNFAQYNLTPPDLIRSDNALHGGHFRVLPIYDAIVCDPPYGIRAGARRTGSRREEVKPVPDHLRADHIPQTRPYAVVRVCLCICV
jgi:tRNA (guanine10-N2)-methyltransferase